MKNKFPFLLLVCISIFLPSCAHLGDTCDTYCLRHGGQCSGIEYGSRRYNTDNGEHRDKPTYFNCKFIN
jgi:hypothetical protein